MAGDLQADVRIANNHGHVLEVAAGGILDALAGDQLELDIADFANEADHAHTVTFGADDLTVIGNTVVGIMTSSSDFEHAHVIDLSCS